MKKILSLALLASLVITIPSSVFAYTYGQGGAAPDYPYSLPGDSGYWSGNADKPRWSDSVKEYPGSNQSVREPQLPGEPCTIIEHGPPRTMTDYHGGCGGGGDGGDPGPPPKPSFIPPTVPTVTNPSPGKYPSWVLNPDTTVKELPQDNEVVRDVNDLLEEESTYRASIAFKNIPVNGLIDLGKTSNLNLEVVARYSENIFEVPFPKSMDSVTQKETDDMWKKFTSLGNTIDVFVFKYDNPSELPQNTLDFFTMDKNKFEFFATIKDSSTDLTNFKLDESGTYILGAKVNYGEYSTHKIIPVRVSKFDSYGWLPVSNNAVAQYNDKLINNGWKQSSHGISDLTAEGSKSLKASSSYNYKHLVTAIGSPNGNSQLTLIKDDTSTYTGGISLPSTFKISEILEYKEGFLVSTLNDGIHYLNLEEGKSHKVVGASIDNVNDIFAENGNLYIATKDGLSTGELKVSLTAGTNSVEKVEYIQAKFISNVDIFTPVTEIDRIEVAIGKIILTPKSNGGVVILDKY